MAAVLAAAMRGGVRAAVVLAAVLCAGAARAAEPAAPRWFKGAVHAHANWGAPQLPTTAPDTVVRWYREHGYHFVAVTDLNHLTPVAGLKALFDAPGRFLVVPGIELSDESLAGGKIVDTIGLFVTGPPTPPSGDTAAQILDGQARAVRRAGGLPIAAHPNLTYALTARDLSASDPGGGPRFFELFNAEPGMNNLGGGGRPSTEALWDAALSQGRVVYATAVDDAHHFHECDAREAARPLALPGRAWIMVRARELSAKALAEALERGDFYASTGVVLESYEAGGDAIRLSLSDRTRDLGWSRPGANPQLYRTELIGRGGRVLATDESLRPTFKLTGREGYVRVRVTSSDGLMAWTQPVFAKPAERSSAAMDVKLGLVILAVEDLPRALAFYRAAFGWEQGVDAPVYAELRLPGAMRVGLYQRDGFGKNTGRVPVKAPAGELLPTELYLYPDDLPAALQRIEKAGGRPLSPLQPRTWGDEAAYFADPDGNVVVLARPLPAP